MTTFADLLELADIERKKGQERLTVTLCEARDPPKEPTRYLSLEKRTKNAAGIYTRSASLTAGKADVERLIGALQRALDQWDSADPRAVVSDHAAYAAQLDW